MKSYIEFKEIPTTTKTKRFEVVSKTDGSKLGEIKWHSPYRKYAIFIWSDWRQGFMGGIDVKIFDTTCLDEISQFIKKLMEEKRKKWLDE
jgi:hypothetical protein